MDAVRFIQNIKNEGNCSYLCSIGEKIGTVSLEDTAKGLKIQTNFTNIPSGPHGTPLTGHLGDLPLLTANNGGHVQEKSIAPRLKLANIKGHAMVIYSGGDNYSDTPKPLGGGGSRIACGVI
ncbi:superoxide dismutase family protein [Acinetobacter nectaris]|nr:superoxide dismutase family protein [Acinetobacter nectaris]